MLKVGESKDVIRERDIYQLLDKVPGVPLLYGYNFGNPKNSYISIQPFAEDLYHYVATNGPLGLRQACGVARAIVSAVI